MAQLESKQAKVGAYWDRQCERKQQFDDVCIMAR